MREHLIDIDPLTGELVQGWARGKISIMKILTTRLRTRLMREWFGSEFMDIQDKPLNQEVWIASLIAAMDAVNLFEPEFRILSMTVREASAAGEAEIIANVFDVVDEERRSIRENIILQGG